MNLFRPKIFSLFKNYSGGKFVNDIIAGIIVVVIFMTKKPAQNQAVVGTDVTVKQEAPKKYYLLGVAGPLGGK